MILPRFPIYLYTNFRLVAVELWSSRHPLFPYLTQRSRGCGAPHAPFLPSLRHVPTASQRGFISLDLSLGVLTTPRVPNPDPVPTWTLPLSAFRRASCPRPPTRRPVALPFQPRSAQRGEHAHTYFDVPPRHPIRPLDTRACSKHVAALLETRRESREGLSPHRAGHPNDRRLFYVVQAPVGTPVDPFIVVPVFVLVERIGYIRPSLTRTTKDV